jgi:hypothetical protein
MVVDATRINLVDYQVLSTSVANDSWEDNGHQYLERVL